MSANRQRAVAAGVIAVAFVLGGLAVEWQVHQGARQMDALVDLVAGWVLGGAGLAAWVAVPGSRIGPLLIASAAAWFVGTLVGADVATGRTDLQRLAGVLVQSHAALLVQALATWPSGRVTRPTQLIVVAGGWIAALFPQIWYDDPGYVVLGVLLAAGLLVDQHTLAPARRAAYRPARDAGLALAAGLVLIPGLAQAFHELDWSVLAAGARLWAVLVAGVAVVLTGALIGRERHGAVADLAVRLAEGESTGFGGELERSLRDATGADASDDPELRGALERAASLAERNLALRVALARQVAELEASRRRLVEIGDEERRALVERLRSGAGARLVRLEIAIRAQIAAAPVQPHGVTIAGGRLARAAEQLALSRTELDGLALGLDPGRVIERGLERAMQELTTQSPVPVELSVSVTRPAEPSAAATLYFVASEGLANVVRHAGARAAWLQVQSDAVGARLLVDDDGVGGADITAGTGLRGLQERLEALGGVLEVGARPGGGTRIRASIPISDAGAPG